MSTQLLFFVTLNKSTEEFTLQEKNLVNLKIPKSWQKPDPNIKSSALWGCHLPVNSLGIVYVSLYPNKLVIKKKKVTSEVDDYDYSEDNEELMEDEDYEESSLIIYQGDLEPNGENDKEKFYRCKLKLQKKDNWESELIALLVLVIGVIAFIAFLNRG